MALGDITIYTKDNGFGYPGDMNYVVGTATTVPTILAGEPVTKAAGSALVTALGSGGPLIAGGPGALTPMVGIAATTSTETTSGAVQGAVSVTPIDADLTYLVSTLATATYFGSNATGNVFPNQATYDAVVGTRVTLGRVGGVGASQLGGTYYINAVDGTANGLIVEELDVQKFPGKVRFSVRKQLSYRN